MSISVPTGKDTMSQGLRTAYAYHRYCFDLVEPFLGKRVVEIACAWGIYTHLLVQSGKCVLGIDLDQECIEYCREKLGDSRASFIIGNVLEERCLDEIAAFKPDSILMMQVLEHLEDDEGVLGALAFCTPGKTRLVCSVPAFSSLYGPMDREAGHYRRYKASTLSSQAAAAGWTVEKIFYSNPLGAVGWWVNNRLLSRITKLNSPHVNSQIRLFDRYILPISKSLEPITRGFFGQTLTLVGSSKG